MRGYDVYLLIVGMALVTYIPRALPAFLMDKLRFGARFQKFLTLLPYTAMAVLIFPGVLVTDESHPRFGVIGVLPAVLLALKKFPLIVCVLAAVAVNCLLHLIF